MNRERIDTAVDVCVGGRVPRLFAAARILGMTSAARMPMMITTSSISTSVKAP